MTSGRSIRGVLLDIEGTTTPIAFVHEVLFPYARSHIKAYLATHLDSAEVLADIAKLRDEHVLDTRHDPQTPALAEGSRDDLVDSLTSYLQWLIDRDRKSPGLKSLQGRVWKQGYLNGTLQAPLFPDVLPALKRWRRAGLKIAIFSSGSILAQKLLFAHTQSGDVTRFIDYYFDTTSGTKSAVESYRRIAAALNFPANQLMFISDVAVELDAARAAGLHTMLCVRPGNQIQPASNHPIIHSCDEIPS